MKKELLRRQFIEILGLTGELTLPHAGHQSALPAVLATPSCLSNWCAWSQGLLSLGTVSGCWKVLHPHILGIDKSKTM